MKHIVFGICATLLILSILLNTMTIEGSVLRDRDMKNALHSALEQALLDAVCRENYDVSDNELLLADATALLMEQLNTKDENLKLALDIAGIDAKDGLLSVHAKETFTYPNGQIGTVEDEATILLEREIPKQRFEISYVLPKNIQNQLLLPEMVRSYCIEERSPLLVPKTPQALSQKGWSIVAWIDKTTNASYTREQLLNMTANTDMTLMAVVEK